MKSNNDIRRSRAQSALTAYAQTRFDNELFDEDEADLRDLLADLMHLVGREEFNNALRMAEIHYEAELTGKE